MPILSLTGIPQNESFSHSKIMPEGDELGYSFNCLHIFATFTTKFVRFSNEIPLYLFFPTNVKNWGRHVAAARLSLNYVFSFFKVNRFARDIHSSGRILQGLSKELTFACHTPLPIFSFSIDFSSRWPSLIKSKYFHLVI